MNDPSSQRRKAIAKLALFDLFAQAPDFFERDTAGFFVQDFSMNHLVQSDDIQHARQFAEELRKRFGRYIEVIQRHSRVCFRENMNQSTGITPSQLLQPIESALMNNQPEPEIGNLFDTYRRPVMDNPKYLRKALGIDEGIPDRVIVELINFCKKYNLQLDRNRQDAFLLRFETGEVMILITVSALTAIARATRLWLPGSVRYEGTGFDLVCYQDSLFREDANSPWQRGAEAACHFNVYYERQPGTSKPTTKWMVDPYKQLFLTSRVRTINDSLADHMSLFRTLEGTLELHQDPLWPAIVNGTVTVAQYRDAQS